MRFSRTNATVSKVHTLFNCCILRKVYFQPLKIARLKNTASLQKQTCVLYAVSHFIPKRRNATVSKVETLFNCCILRKVYFQPLKIARLKNTVEFAQAQTSRIIVCAFRAPMQQSPEPDVSEDCCILRKVYFQPLK